MDLLPSNVPQFTFEVEGLPQKLRVAGFSGSERLSELFRFTFALASEDSEIDFLKVVGKPAVLTILSLQGQRYVNGIISRFEYGGSDGRFTLYTAELVPRLWLLSHRYTSRIFQDKSVPEIVKQVLNEAGMSSDDYRFVLRSEYAPRKYCVQYREPEKDFLCRLLEEEGIFFFFEHTDKSHVLVMGDDQAAHVPTLSPAKVIFHERHGTVPTEEYVYQFRYAEGIQPGAVVLEDFNFERPSLELRVHTQTNSNTSLEKYDYPGEYTTPETGQRLAQVRLEELQVPRKVAQGLGGCRRFVPGYRFHLDRYPRSPLNQEYILTSINHKAVQPQVLEEQGRGQEFSYANEFACIPYKVPFRPARITPRPVVHGSQTAIVVGPEGEELYTDEHGRVKVQFHWDREGKRNENSSCWIRVSQPWAGKGWGTVSIPRIGQEVIIDFLEGDPDQPIITGRVYNGEQMPPYGLPAGQVMSGIKSKSIKGGGYNEFIMNDTQGSELIRVHGQYDMDTTIEHDQREHILHDRSRDVTNNETISIGKDRTATIGNNETMRVGNNRVEVIGANVRQQVGANHSSTISANMSVTVGANKNETVAIASAENVGAAKALNVGAGYSIVVIGAMNTAVGLASFEEVGLTKKVIVGTKFEIVCGSSRIVLESGGKVTIEGTEFLFSASGTVKINGKVIDLN